MTKTCVDQSQLRTTYQNDVIWVRASVFIFNFEQIQYNIQLIDLL